MKTRTDEIADGIFRISTCVSGITPDGFTFNQFLIKAEEPLLFHTGLRVMFPLVSEAVSRVVPIERLRWITFGHVEADECGSMNQWLEAAPKSRGTLSRELPHAHHRSDHPKARRSFSEGTCPDARIIF
jgi:flavorubredoxin